MSNKRPMTPERVAERKRGIADAQRRREEREANANKRPLTPLMVEVLKAMARREEQDDRYRYRGITAGFIASEIRRSGDGEIAALLGTEIRQHGNGAKDGRSWSGTMHDAQRLHGPLASLRRRGLIWSGFERGKATMNHLTRKGRAMIGASTS